LGGAFTLLLRSYAENSQHQRWNFGKLVK